MRGSLRLLELVVLLSMVVGCGQIVADEVGQRVAKDGLNEVVADMPQVDGFETLKVIDIEAYSQTGPITHRTCYYARKFYVFGTASPEPEAIDTYRKKLQDRGWRIEDRPFLDDSLLTRGANDRLNIGPATSDVVKRGGLDYAQLRETYRGLVSVRVDYMVPQRDGC